MPNKTNETRLNVLEFIVNYMEGHRYSPTRDEIGQAVGLGVRSSVQYHIDVLVEDGFLERKRQRHRMIHPTDKGKRVIEELRAING